MIGHAHIAFMCFALMMGIAFGIAAFLEADPDHTRKSPSGDMPRYRPAPYHYIPLALVLGCPVIALLAGGSSKIFSGLFVLFLPVVVIIAIYDAALLLLLPLLRRRINARACASLWQLPFIVPFFYVKSKRLVSDPLLTLKIPLSIPEAWQKWFLYVWLAGFCAALLWHTVSHLRFRKKLLKDAWPIEDEMVLDVWAQELADANFSRTFLLMASPCVQTPLSIGLFCRTTCVLLPERGYTPEELSLIFRHELIHISRKDALAKLSLVLGAAVLWFNPLQWLAVWRASEDLELSCDETVLLGCDTDTRKEYAQLLLQTAADNRGFTTCLSASASALRYRLRQVMARKARSSGAFAVGFATVLLLLSSLFVGVSFG